MLRTLKTSFKSLTLLLALTAPLLSTADPAVRDHRGNHGNGNGRGPIVRDHRPGSPHGNPHGNPGRPVAHPGRPFPKRPRPSHPPRYPDHPVFGPRRPGRLFTPPPRIHGNPHEVDAAEIIADAIRDRGCESAGAALRQISNTLLDSSKFETSDNSPPIGGDQYARRRYENHHRWRANLRNPEFIKEVFARLATMYRECNRECFDDGVAIGQISGTGYCAASIGVGGLNGPGFQAQLPMPVCSTATFVGCQEGYNDAASSFEGCGAYISGGFTDIFNESKSQDCRMD